MKEVTGLTIVQGLAASLTGVLVHRRFQMVNRDLVVWLGSSIGISALAGGILSRFVSDDLLRIIFAALALLAAALMLTPKREESAPMTAQKVTFSKPLGVLCASLAGFLGGLVGQGSAFILIPLMLHLLKLPLRVVIGSSLGIVFFSAVAGFIGKLGTGQIPLDLALALILGVIPGSQFGGLLSIRTPQRLLRQLLAAFIALSAVRIAWETFA